MGDIASRLELPRRTLENLVMSRLWSLAVEALAQRDFGNAYERALAVVERDPLSERNRRLLISVCLAEGNQVDAILQFEQYRELLAEELGLEPSASLLALVTEAGHSTGSPSLGADSGLHVEIDLATLTETPAPSRQP